MPKKKGKGGKKKRRGKKTDHLEKRKLEFKEDGQEYARVLKMLGDGRLEGRCSDGKTRVCHIRGKFRKRVWINAGDLILVDIREYQQDKADVVYKYNSDEDRTLQSYGELTGGTAKDDRIEEEEGEEGQVRFHDPLGDNVSEDSEDTGYKSEEGSLESILENL